MLVHLTISKVLNSYCTSRLWILTVVSNITEHFTHITGGKDIQFTAFQAKRTVTGIKSAQIANPLLNCKFTNALHSLP